MRSSLPASRHSRFLLLALAASVFAGCELMPQTPLTGQDRSAPSASPACQERCVRPKEECEKRQTAREQDCQERGAKAKTIYASCTTHKDRSCHQPVPCLGADLAICQIEYADCVRECEATKGETPPVGRKTPVERPDDAPTPTQTPAAAPAPATTKKSS